MILYRSWALAREVAPLQTVQVKCSSHETTRFTMCGSDSITSSSNPRPSNGGRLVHRAAVSLSYIILNPTLRNNKTFTPKKRPISFGFVFRNPFPHPSPLKAVSSIKLIIIISFFYNLNPCYVGLGLHLFLVTPWISVLTKSSSLYPQ